MQVLQKLNPSSSRVYLGGSCPPNAILTFNQLNAIRNIQMIFINKANPLKQIIILMRKGRTIPALTTQIPL
jgi:adenosine/AMP kinase